MFLISIRTQSLKWTDREKKEQRFRTSKYSSNLDTRAKPTENLFVAFHR